MIIGTPLFTLALPCTPEMNRPGASPGFQRSRRNLSKWATDELHTESSQRIRKVPFQDKTCMYVLYICICIHVKFIKDVKFRCNIS